MSFAQEKYIAKETINIVNMQYYFNTPEKRSEDKHRFIRRISIPERGRNMKYANVLDK